MRAALAILGGAVLLVWPALLNGYPIVFIDTVSYLNQTTLPELPWDKTLAYGPFLHLFHWRLTLWPAVAAQGLIASHLFWLAQRGDANASALILSALEKDPAPDVRKRAVFALSQLRDDQGVDALIRVARSHADAPVRGEAIFWLGQSKDPRAIEFFAEILK